MNPVQLADHQFDGLWMTRWLVERRNSPAFYAISLTKGPPISMS